MRTFPLLDEQAIAWGGNMAIEITYADCTSASAAQTIATDLTLTAYKQGLQCIAAVLVTPFVTAESGHISTTFALGDAGSTGRQLAAVETNSQGTYVSLKAGALSAVYVGTTDTAITVTAAATATKNLNTLTAGKIWFICRKLDQTLIT